MSRILESKAVTINLLKEVDFIQFLEDNELEITISENATKSDPKYYTWEARIGTYCIYQEHPSGQLEVVRTVFKGGVVQDCLEEANQKFNDLLYALNSGVLKSVFLAKSAVDRQLKPIKESKIQLPKNSKFVLIL